ncbi:dnaJ homolog subfamily C member 14 [Microcaecilia unicolor]|uniref:DnaJ homolog subfamily C member 14 n=1 Tax=Microcaecilia unicolor TaxID=1415580 RepID=A0A6P7XHA0_9AMPH|nr:dnaJ homolog subfamily C member 14 [Microcaecilia unicolor]XP_030052575.1 dnaJ homolog subfamily C member 14 [Microcaecilia unicolor]XP_030052577.1 dnaJ homolog subfamily C member 14 [Microcaecilia unicolor]XP_030052578.1 dnaJ homolog subfamily C member 14 [Microcaecilia unicolor]XP_030052579.1 dnaJ homolog subfamily C member 14 [Microcaecilia unicolor]XP_030052580.1 dnaJ homolog subfamily C member 14 [Microcaecilia unicolor]XP_030052581.1 dnaJ homolog subfamily C member 14 [Microcaecilia 
MYSERAWSCSFTCYDLPFMSSAVGTEDLSGGHLKDLKEAAKMTMMDGPEKTIQCENHTDSEDSSRLNGIKRGDRRQKNCSSQKEKEDQRESSNKEGKCPSSASRKNKPTRKKTQAEGKRLLRPELRRQEKRLLQVCISYFRMFVDLLQAHEGFVQQLRSVSVRLKHWACYWGDLMFRLLKMLCALLVLILMVAIGCLRLCWCYAKSAFSSAMVKLRKRDSGTAQFASDLGLPFMWRFWTWLKGTRTCGYLAKLLQKWKLQLWTSKRLRTNKEIPVFSSHSTSTKGHYRPNEEVERLLKLSGVPEEELDPFKALGVEVTASDVELKKAYRQLAVLVHPDKNQHPHAEEAFKVLRSAWDIVSSPEKRKEYEMKQMANSELIRSMDEFFSKLQDDLKEAMNTMMCNKCQGKHRRFEMDRDALHARYCAKCSKMHPAEEGNFWAESSMLGFKITYFAMMDGKVYDITEWAGCQHIGITPDTHRVPYHISFGSRNSRATGRQRTSSERSSPSAADLQDLFSRIFQGSPGPMPNGDFLNTTSQQSSPDTAFPTPPKSDSATKVDARSKRKKKVRRPFQR